MTTTADMMTQTLVAAQQPGDSQSTTATSTISQVSLSTISLTGLSTLSPPTACSNSLSTVTITLPGTCSTTTQSTSTSSTPYYPNYGSSSTYQFPPPSGTVPPPMRTLTAGGSRISLKLEEGAPFVAGFVILLSFVVS